MQILVHTGEKYLRPNPPLTVGELGDYAEELTTKGTRGGEPSPEVVQAATRKDGGWKFPVSGTGFSGTLRIGIEKDAFTQTLWRSAMAPGLHPDVGPAAISYPT